MKFSLVGVFPAESFSLLFTHLTLKVCAPVSRYEGGGSYVCVLSLPVASSLGTELPLLAWDALGHLPPGFGAPWSSRFVPEGSQLGVQPQTERQDPGLAS